MSIAVTRKIGFKKILEMRGKSGKRGGGGVRAIDFFTSKNPFLCPFMWLVCYILYCENFNAQMTDHV